MRNNTGADWTLRLDRQEINRQILFMIMLGHVLVINEITFEFVALTFCGTSCLTAPDIVQPSTRMVQELQIHRSMVQKHTTR